MPLRVSFVLSDRDLRYFRKVMTEVAERFDGVDGDEVIANASLVLHDLPDDTPEFITERMEKLQSMVDMLRDREWHLEGSDRDRVIRALSYFADPQDLIPDSVPGIGFLDDAIMVELVVLELQHELEAYADFCRFRTQKDSLLSKGAQDATHREEWLEARRNQLLSRMKRRRRRQRGPRRSRQSTSPIRLW